MTATTPDATPPPADEADVRAAARLTGLDLTDKEVGLMLAGAGRNRDVYARLREKDLPNHVQSALRFSPRPGAPAPQPDAWDGSLPDAERPGDLEALAWADISTLASLVRSRRVSCVELAELSLARL